MNDSIVVRQARKSDVMSISQILSQSWKAAFNDFFSPDELSQIASEERFFSILENVIVSNMGELRVATLDDTPVGEIFGIAIRCAMQQKSSHYSLFPKYGEKGLENNYCCRPKRKANII